MENSPISYVTAGLVSAAGESKELSRIIEEVLAAGRMLVPAATSRGPRYEDFRRDDWGRFAAEDDSSAAI